MQQLMLIFKLSFVIVLLNTSLPTASAASESVLKSYLAPSVYVQELNLGDTLEVTGTVPTDATYGFSLSIMSPSQGLSGVPVASRMSEGENPKSLSISVNQGGQWLIYFSRLQYNYPITVHVQIKVNGVVTYNKTDAFSKDYDVLELPISNSPCLLQVGLDSPNVSTIISFQLFSPTQDYNSQNFIASETFAGSTATVEASASSNGSYFVRAQQQPWQSTPSIEYTLTYSCSCEMAIDHCLSCSSSINCLQCSENYVVSNRICEPCSSVLTNCAVCLNASVCLQCDANYLLSSDTDQCQPCDSQLPQCLTCSDALTCTGCEANFQLTPDNLCEPCSFFLDSCLQCINTTTCTQCAVDTMLDLATSQCRECEFFVPNCLSCSQADNCTHCTFEYFLESPEKCSPCSESIKNCSSCSNSGEVCFECSSQEYFLHFGGTECAPCGDYIQGCISCTNITHCIKCASQEFYLKEAQCLVCRQAMQMCLECSDEDTCLTVVNDTYEIDPATSKPTKCQNLIPSCNRCSNETVCLECVSSHFLFDHKCESCSAHCISCVDSATCTLCQVGFEVGNSGKCQCIEGWQVTGFCTTQHGCFSYRKVSSSPSQYLCIACDEEKKFIYNIQQNICECRQGFQPRGDTCQPICGEGSVFRTQKCDDGNIINGDGCSYDCQVENGYFCSEGSPYSPSICRLDTQLSVSYLYVSRIDGTNSAGIHFSISPSPVALGFFNLTKAVRYLQIVSLKKSAKQRVSSNLPDSVRFQRVQYLQQQGKIIVEFEYSDEALLQSDTEIDVHLDMAQFSRSQSTSEHFSVSTSDMYPKLTYNQNTDSFAAIRTALQVLSSLSLAFMLLSCFWSKTIGVETVHTLQFVWLLGFLSTVDPSNTNLQPSQHLFKALSGLSWSLGLTPILQGSWKELTQPENLRYFTENKSFTLNANLFAAALFTFAILWAILALQGFVRLNHLRETQSKISKVQKKIKRKHLKAEVKSLQDQKSTLQENELKLKEDIYFNSRYKEIIHERVLYPLVMLLTPLFIVLMQIQNSAHNKNSEGIPFRTASLTVMTPFALILFGIHASQMRKVFSSAHKKTAQQNIKFYSFSLSCSSSAVHLYPSLYSAAILLIPVLVELSSLYTEKRTALSISICCFSLSMGVVSWVLTPYKVEVNNRAILLNWVFVSVFAGFMAAYLSEDKDLELLRSQTSVTIFLSISVLALFSLLFLGLYRLFQENKHAEECAPSIKKRLEIVDCQFEPRRNVKETFHNNPYICHNNRLFEENLSLADYHFSELRGNEPSFLLSNRLMDHKRKESL